MQFNPVTLGRPERRSRLPLIASLALAGALVIAAIASADTVGPINFESGYTNGNINGQNGWSKTGSYDVEVEDVADYPAASGYGFGTKALRMSDAVTTGAFGDQTFTPSTTDEAGEAGASNGGFSSGTRQQRFETAFSIGTTLATQQSGLHVSVSPDRGDGARMSYLRFEDQADGVHVFFIDVTDPGPSGTTADFNETDIATLSRTQAHTIRLVIDFVDGAGNDVVQVFVDGALEVTGTTWEDYYRFDPEQSGGGNLVPTVDSALFRESGGANPGNAGQGFLIDNVALGSGPTPVATPPIGAGGTPPAGGTLGQAQSGGTVKKKRGCKRKKTANAVKRCKRKKK